MSTAAADGAGLARRDADSCDVFICHKSEYKPWVEWLAHALVASGRSVFLDIWNLVPGDSWVEGLHRGLERCRAAILVATPEVVNSGWVREEYNALQRRRQAGPDFRLIPVVFGNLPNLPFLANLQAVDCRDPEHYRKWFHLLLCGLDGREPGPRAVLPVALDPPPPLRRMDASSAVPGEQSFVQRVMGRVARPVCPPVIITSRGSRYQGPVIQALLQQMRSGPAAPELLHLTPPFSEQASTEAYFNDLGRQCSLDLPTPDATAFTAAFDRRIEAAHRLYLLVSGFENASAGCRKEFAGALRSLTERWTDRLRVVLLGGERLIEQKYAAGPASFLSHALVEEWPPASAGDVIAWQQLEHPHAPPVEPHAQELLEISGGHAGLVRYCLERWDVEGGPPCWAEWCYLCDDLWATWHRLARESPDLLRESLGRNSFGRAAPWPTDPTARRLYWADLLTAKGTQLVWRAEVMRQVGSEVIG